MKIDCDVARDLMPLVVDGTASMKSCAIVDEHVGTCEPCREMLEEMRQEVEAGVSKEDAGPLVKKLRRRRLLRRALLVLLGMALCVLLAFVGREGWKYYCNDFCVLTAEENYDISLFPQSKAGTVEYVTALDGNRQRTNSYFDEETGDLYLWSTTTRVPWPAQSKSFMVSHTGLFYFDDIGYAQVVLAEKRTESGQRYFEVMPVNRILKGAPTWFTGSDGSYTVIFEGEHTPDEALMKEWQTRLSEWEIDRNFVWETE